MTFIDYLEQGRLSEQSAKATLNNTLAQYGLEGLGEFAWKEYLLGFPIEQILIDIRNTPEYKTRFPAMDYLGQQGKAITEAEYINYERSAASIMQAAGLPPGFYDQPSDFANFLKNDVALPELQNRVDLARTAIYQSDPDTLSALEDFYGAWGTPENMVGDLTAYFLDEQKALPLIQTRLAAAQTQSAAQRSGYGQITRTEAERLANLGITPEAAGKGFGSLASIEPLFTNLPGEVGTTPTREQGQAAAFENNAEAQQAIEKQRRRRAAPFEQGGRFQQGQGGGFSGL
jgi:hypothetical protein